MSTSKSQLLRDFLNSIDDPSQYDKSTIFEMFKQQAQVSMHYGQFHQVYQTWALSDRSESAAEQKSVTFELPEEEEPEFVKTKQIGDKLDPILLEPLKTGKIVDEILSDEHGLLRGMVTMVTGESGVGKSTVLGSIVADVEKNNDNVNALYIQGEQSSVDVGYAYKKAPQTAEVNNLLLNDYKNTKSVLEKTFDSGQFDVIVIDSLADILERLKTNNHMNRSAALHWFLNLMVKTSESDNENQKYTTFLCIQQVTKGGDYKGSTAIKHNTTAFVELRFDETDPSRRYLFFSKHRRCGDKVYRRVYYDQNENGKIVYDEKRFRQEGSVIEISSRNDDWTEQEHEDWDETFSGAQEAGDDPEVTA